VSVADVSDKFCPLTVAMVFGASTPGMPSAVFTTVAAQ
jgi:hypothetical protein